MTRQTPDKRGRTDAGEPIMWETARTRLRDWYIVIIAIVVIGGGFFLASHQSSSTAPAAAVWTQPRPRRRYPQQHYRSHSTQ